MTDIQLYHDQFVNHRTQLSVIDSDGKLLNSCNTILNFSLLIGHNPFVNLKLTKELKPILAALSPGSQFQISSQELYFENEKHVFEMEFIRLASGQPNQLIWIIRNSKWNPDSFSDLGTTQNKAEANHKPKPKTDELIRQYSRKIEKLKEDMERFAYIVSHDLKTPLRGIRNLSNWIIEDLGDDVPQEIKDHCALLHRQVHRMDALIEGILEYSRAGQAQQEKELIDIDKLVREIFESIENPKQIRIETNPDLPAFSTHKTLLRQVLSQLISNSIKHHDKENGWVKVNCKNENDRIYITVIDNGPGIAPEHHSRIFEIFQTLSNKHPQNTGVGLTIVQKIINEMGESLSLESERETGAKFTFTWPVH